MSLILANSFLRLHNVEEAKLRGKHINTRNIPYSLLHVCRQLRNDALPTILEKTVLYCCHMGSRLVSTHLPSIYCQNIRTLHIDTTSFGCDYIISLRPDVLHRRCTVLPDLPKLQVLIIYTHHCMRLRRGITHADLASDRVKVSRTRTNFIVGRHAARALLKAAKFQALHPVLNNRQRGFKLQIYSYMADMHMQAPPTVRGNAAVSLLP